MRHVRFDILQTIDDVEIALAVVLTLFFVAFLVCLARAVNFISARFGRALGSAPLSIDDTWKV